MDSSSELIPIVPRQIGDETVQAVDARTLYQSLELASPFADWMKYQIESLNLIEGMDFVIFSEKSEKRGRPTSEYFLTIDCAKHLAMTSRSEKGFTVRKYFIEVEKRFKLQSHPELPTDFLSALKALVAKEEENQRQALVIAEQKPKAEFFDAVAGSKDAIAMGDVAKVLAISGMGRNNLFKFLRDEKILMQDNQPYQEFIDREYFRVIEQKWNEADGSVRVSFKTLVYQKGLDFIRRTVAKAQGKTALTLAPGRMATR